MSSEAKALEFSIANFMQLKWIKKLYCTWFWCWITSCMRMHWSDALLWFILCSNKSLSGCITINTFIGGGSHTRKWDAICNCQTLCINWGTCWSRSHFWSRGQYNGIILESQVSSFALKSSKKEKKKMKLFFFNVDVCIYLISI